MKPKNLIFFKNTCLPKDISAVLFCKQFLATSLHDLTLILQYDIGMHHLPFKDRHLVYASIPLLSE